MALDGIFLRHIKKEIEEKLIDSKVDKIYQPFRDEIILYMRSREGTEKLLISAKANSPRINLTAENFVNPKTPPMLCMLLRKRLSGARLRSVFQPELERLLLLEFEAKNELGDTIMLKLAVEIMGQYSNIILIDEKGSIIDAVKRVDASMSGQRLVLPGMKYEPPPKQEKMCILQHDAEEIIQAAEGLAKTVPLSKGLLSVIQGISPVICRELEYLTARGGDISNKELDQEKQERLLYFLKRVITTARECTGEPYLITDLNGKPIDFTFQYIQQYGSGRATKETKTFSELLDRYYAKKDAAELLRTKSEDLTRLMNNTAARLIKKIYVQNEELKSCADREYLHICGDLLQANLYRIEKGAAFAEVENYYEESMPLVKIELDPALSASANAQRYYKKYRKAKTAEQVLKIQLAKAEEELDYVSAVLDSINRAADLRELDEIREELTEQGYLKAKGKKQKKETALPPLSYQSPGGFTILVGRNNCQNDRLTLKQADKNDLWLHTKDIPGSHTIILTGGREPDEETILYAARLAAGHSKARDAGKVPVDYTKTRYVSKPQGAKPGMVIYTHQQTLFVAPITD